MESLSKSAFHCRVDSFLHQLPLPQTPNNKGGRNHSRAQERRRNEALLVLGRINLLPYDQRQPRLHHIRHLVHTADHNGALLVVFAADLVCPGHAQARDASAAAGKDVACPVPASRDVPDRERDIADD